MTTAAWALTSVNLAFFVVFMGLALYGRFYLALVVGLLGQVSLGSVCLGSAGDRRVPTPGN